MTLREIAAAVSGTVHDAGDGDDVTVTAPAFVDSRAGTEGGLFVALAGGRVDGHDYAAAAVAAGAAAVLAARPVGVPAVVVPDGVAALGKLAAHLLARRTDLTLVGITGSAGKTTTKDLIAHMLRGIGPTVSTPGNFNNEIGLPLTVSLADADTRFLVLEMGARAIGHIAYLTEIAPPRIGVVLNVGTAHIGEFGGVEAITQGKGELVEALPEDGLAVLNADDPRVLSMAARTRARVTTFGRSTEADIRALDVSLDGGGRASFILQTPEGSAPVSLRLLGEHQVANALASAAVARELGLSVEQIATALAGAGAVSRGRMEIVERPDGVTIVNDAYNANPDSMRAALRTLTVMANGRRKIAVLGTMLGLGDDTEPEHIALGAEAAAHGIDVLIAVGDQEAAWIAAGALAAGLATSEVLDTAKARPLLDALLEPGDLVLLKASQDLGLQVLGEELSAVQGKTDTPEA